MGRKPRPVPIDVRRLSVREIVDLWVREIEIHPITLERELRRFLVNSGLAWREGERINPDTPDADLPGAETLVDKDWVRMFCGKKDWSLPTFWFPPDPEEVRRRGRPSVKCEIVRKFEERREQGQTRDTISKEADEISAWLQRQGHKKGTQSKTVQKHIRPLYDEWKRRSNL